MRVVVFLPVRKHLRAATLRSLRPNPAPPSVIGLQSQEAWGERLSFVINNNLTMSTSIPLHKYDKSKMIRVFALRVEWCLNAMLHVIWLPMVGTPVLLPGPYGCRLSSSGRASILLSVP